MLRERLITRGTENAQMLEERLAKAEYELLAAPEFDLIIVNDDLEVATQELMRVTQDFIAHGAAWRKRSHWHYLHKVNINR